MASRTYEYTNKKAIDDDLIKKQCPKGTVVCSAADVKCPWMGPVDQLKQHVASCSYEQIRHVLVEFTTENENLKNLCNQQQAQIGELEARIQKLERHFRAATRQLVISPNARWTQSGITLAGGHSSGNDLNQLGNPRGLYVDDDQNILIADYDNHRIVEWKCGAASGQVVAGGNGKGNRNDQLSGPTDVIVDKETDCLIICDRENRRIMRWPRRGGTSGQTIISNVYSYGLTMDDDDFLYVCDWEKHEVKRWGMGETEGILVAGGKGKGERLDQLNCPLSVFVDRDHSVYVSDCENHRVIKWVKDAKEGNVVAGGGEGLGNALTQVSYPQGVIVDQLGTVYVADYSNHRIMRWSKGATQGSVIVGGNRRGGQANQLHSPVGLSFDRHGNLYVADNGNHRIQKFLLEGR